MIRSSLFCAITLLFTISLAAESIPAQQMMTPAERQSIGYDKLSSQEKNAFEQWAGKWTQSVLDQAPTHRPGQNLSMWVQTWPGYANPTKTELSADDLAEKQLRNQFIDLIRNDGEFIDLKDGSVWRISPFFRYLTTKWQKGQTVEVKSGPNQLHPWLVHNISVGQVADADLTRAPSPTGVKETLPADFYKGTVTVQNITQPGDILTLADGTVWKIAPTDMYKAKNWAPSDRIRIEQSDNFLYTYRLTNLDTGEVALGNPRK
jgi:hypothetical protein